MNCKVYTAGLKFMLQHAVKELFNGEVIYHHSLDHGVNATVICDTELTKSDINKIKNKMSEYVERDIPFKRRTISKQDAYNFYKKRHYQEKAFNVLNISNLTVSLFEFDGDYNYFYQHEMPKSSKDLVVFDIYHIKENDIVLLYPIDGEIKFTFRNRIYNAFHEYDEWLNRQGIDYVSNVNNIIAKGGARELVKRNDILLNNNLYEVAQTIYKEGKRIILIAGPSSSGKTTTSRKLSLYLSAFGVTALPISLDDFFVDRGETPIGENGKPDYECLEAVDLKLFEEKLNQLLEGESVQLPTYNFVKGMKEYKNDPKSIDSNDCLVIEGLHALNPQLVADLNQSLIYKIYISPLTPLNVDRHNYVSTTDNRLIRRIVRDFRTRGRSAEASLATWASVRAGEEKHIFPYTDTCDAILNTAYVYELGVLKVYVEPLLYNIKMDSEYYGEARRLLDELKTFYAIPSEYVAEDNLLREFIGGSSFEE